LPSHVSMLLNLHVCMLMNKRRLGQQTATFFVCYKTRADTAMSFLLNWLLASDLQAQQSIYLAEGLNPS